MILVKIKFRINIKNVMMQIITVYVITSCGYLL